MRTMVLREMKALIKISHCVVSSNAQALYCQLFTSSGMNLSKGLELTTKLKLFFCNVCQ